MDQSSVDQAPRQQTELVSLEAEATRMAIIGSTTDPIWSVASASIGLRTFNEGVHGRFSRRRGNTLKRGMRPEDLFPTREAIGGETPLGRSFF